MKEKKFVIQTLKNLYDDNKSPLTF